MLSKTLKKKERKKLLYINRNCYNLTLRFFIFSIMFHVYDHFWIDDKAICIYFLTFAILHVKEL